MVRNLGAAGLGSSSVTRDIEEDTFFAKTAPWSSVDKDKVGVKSLEIRLQDILATHIKREFPSVSNATFDMRWSSANAVSLHRFGQNFKPYSTNARTNLTVLVPAVTVMPSSCTTSLVLLHASKS